MHQLPVGTRRHNDSGYFVSKLGILGALVADLAMIEDQWVCLGQIPVREPNSIACASQSCWGATCSSQSQKLDAQGEVVCPREFPNVLHPTCLAKQCGLEKGEQRERVEKVRCYQPTKGRLVGGQQRNICTDFLINPALQIFVIKECRFLSETGFGWSWDGRVTSLPPTTDP
jgi:hypothetical protein